MYRYLKCISVLGGQGAGIIFSFLHALFDLQFIKKVTGMRICRPGTVLVCRICHIKIALP